MIRPMPVPDAPTKTPLPLRPGDVIEVRSNLSGTTLWVVTSAEVTEGDETTSPVVELGLVQVRGVTVIADRPAARSVD